MSRRAHVLAACLAGLALAAGPVRAQQAGVPGAHRGSLTLSLQVVTDHYHLNGHGDLVDAGKITGRTAALTFDYGLTDRLAVSVYAPFVSKRYIGAFPHNTDPYNHDDGHDHEHIAALDDGAFHGGWQDWGVGARWQFRPRGWMVTPFVNYAWPSHDYTWFAHAAIGTRQERLQVGTAVAKQFGPRLQKLYFQGSYSYTFVEEVQDISVDFSTLNLEVGWFFTPRFSARALVTYRKTHGGLDFPFDFPSRTDELFLHHDQVQRVDYLNYGFGAAYRINDRYTVNGTWMTTGWGENGHAIHNAVTLALTRSF
jgi:hypothetical protein